VNVTPGAAAWSGALNFAAPSAGFYAGLAWIPEILQSEGHAESAAGALWAISALVSKVPARAVPRAAARPADQRPILLVLTAAAAAGVVGLLMARWPG